MTDATVKAPKAAKAAAAKPLPRLKAEYRKEIIAALTAEFGFTNPHQVPNLTKIVVNMGVGDAARDARLPPVPSPRRRGLELLAGVPLLAAQQSADVVLDAEADHPGAAGFAQLQDACAAAGGVCPRAVATWAVHEWNTGPQPQWLFDAINGFLDTPVRIKEPLSRASRT